MSISGLRTDYQRDALTEAAAGDDPLSLFGRWFDEARTAVREPNAMIVATVDPSGQPAARTMLLKDFGPRGFVFFTNFDSRKGRALAANPRVALLFFWQELERQVRIEGIVEAVPAAESDQYFGSRPLGSRYSAWASPQSTTVTDRTELENRVAQAEREFPGPAGPPRPACWGGFCAVPATFEFWQGRASRLHDRLHYLREGTGWKRSRLAP
jgi:pyridoxamine 5'-phosphate oxidase